MHAEQDSVQRWVASCNRMGKRKGGAGIVQHPTVSRAIRVGGIEIQVDGAAEVYPSHDGEPVFFGERFHLSLLDRIRRRHLTPDVVQVPLGSVFLFVHGFSAKQELSGTRFRFGWVVVVGETV